MVGAAQSVGAVESIAMEIEAKFAITNATVTEQMKTVESIDAFQIAPGKTIRVHDTYLDTRDRRLLAAGYACRRRKQDNRLLITLKQIRSVEGAIHAREELEIVLSQDVPPAEWSDSPARERVLSLIGDKPLRKLFELRQTRVQRDVLKDNVVIAEWSVDQAQARVGTAALQFAELEIESKGGTEADLTHIAALVQSEWNLAPEPQSKFERALSWVNEIKSQNKQHVATKKPRRRSAPKIKLDDTMAEAARKTLLLHWGRMLGHEAGARAGSDIEQVHDMRVATRRMRAALRVFAEYLDVDAFKPFAKMLRRTARALGAVRDLDVFREKAQHYIETLPAERKSELDGLLVAWQTEYQRARRELIALFDSAAFARFKTEFDKFLRTPGAGALPSETTDGKIIAHRVRNVLPMILLRGYADVRAYDEAVKKIDVPLSQLHQLRIASKGLRYTLEFFADVLKPDAQALIERMKELQDHLGNLQDAVVACNILRDFLTWGKWSDVTQKSPRRRRTIIVAPGVAAYLAARQNEIHALVQTFPRVWSPIIHADFKRQLLALIAAW